MRRIVKQVLLGVAAIVAIVPAGAGLFVYTQTSAFDASMDKVYDVPVRAVARSTDLAVLARGKHVTDALGACTVSKCHGTDLGGGDTIKMGPVATFTGPNITTAALGVAYTDGELARLIQHGIKKDGRSVAFMPSKDFGWLPDADVDAMISHIRTMPPVQKPNGPTGVKMLGKILDRREQFPLDIARHIDHTKREAVPAPAPSAEYGRFLVRVCTGCHGPQLSGGPLPGAPPSFPIPKNLTPDATGLAGWSFEDFDKLITLGVNKTGQNIEKLMPIEAFGKMNDLEKRALWEYLKTVPPLPFGNR